MADYDDDDPWLRERWPPEEQRPPRRSVVSLVLIVALGVALGEGLVAGIAHVLPRMQEVWQSIESDVFSTRSGRAPMPAESPNPEPAAPLALPDLSINSPDDFDRDIFRQQTVANCEAWRERARREASPFNMRMRDQVCGVLDLLD